MGCSSLLSCPLQDGVADVAVLCNDSVMLVVLGPG